MNRAFISFLPIDNLGTIASGYSLSSSTADLVFVPNAVPSHPRTFLFPMLFLMTMSTRAADLAINENALEERGMPVVIGQYPSHRYFSGTAPTHNL
jgi:hypothetical protein